MPSFQANLINNHIQQAVPGIPAYAFGAFDYTSAGMVATITNVALTSNVATVTMTIKEGNIPTTSQLISVKSDNTIFNVDSAAITGVSFTAATGVGTVTYAVTHANVTSVAATGTASAPVAPTTDVFANGASVPICIQDNTGPEEGRTLRATVTIPSLPTAGVVKIQTAVGDPSVASNYVDLGTVATVTGSALTGGTSNNTVAAVFTSVNANFVRFIISGTSGGSSPTLYATVTI